MTQINIFQELYDDLKEQSKTKDYEDVVNEAWAEFNDGCRLNYYGKWEAGERQQAIATFKFDIEEMS